MNPRLQARAGSECPAHASSAAGLTEALLREEVQVAVIRAPWRDRRI